ncbi:hypothetical protein [Sediminicoccus sp. KRV36]|uniref:hypothetical protein n=1 Tax=Sediminicoccus sp. KRV36 TaxID=3133721 RepID=UPI00200C31B5|nr:hypothetical protein [Sediminicoccus rosea]UPY38865.1 hypothetical protein LHU95_09260 [Sediminicoccus rosea]
MAGSRHAMAWLPPSGPLAAAYHGDRLLAAIGLFLLLCLVPTGAAHLLDTRGGEGPGAWVKPMKFQLSLAVHLLTIAWMMLLLPGRVRRGWMARALVLALVAASLFEAGYIAWAASRGIASHYHVATPFGVMMYRLMGVGAVCLVLATIGMGALVLRHGEGPRVIVEGAGLGLVLGGVLGGATGVWMSVQPGHGVGLAGDAVRWAVLGWLRNGGDLRVAHFFGLHMIQALTILAVLLWATEQARWRGLLYGAAALGTLFTLGTFLQAMLGRPFA